MSTTNSRFKDLGEGQIVELISYHTQLFYNPTTQHARAIFNGAYYLPVAGQFHRIGEKEDVLHVDLMGRMTDCVAKPGDVDPVTGVSLENISNLGQMLLMKRTYDKYHNEEAARIAAEIAAAQAAADTTNNAPVPGSTTPVEQLIAEQAIDPNAGTTPGPAAEEPTPPEVPEETPAPEEPEPEPTP